MIHKTTRSILSVLLAVLLLVTSVPLTPAFAGDGGVSLQLESGEGRALEPVNGEYQIYTADDLKEFAAIVNGTDSTPADSDADARLMNDIDLSSVCSEENGTWTPIGNSIKQYSGTFNGDGHTISGLYINSSRANDQGLFGFVGSEGTVQNLTVSGSVSGHWYVGGVVGYNGGSVENCYNTGSVTGSGWYVGGVVGDNGGSVTNSYNTGAVNSSGNYVGGVVGWNISSGNVTNCYNTGAVSGGEYVGGVVGYNSSSVKNCYNTGKVIGSSVGGVVGLDGGGSVTGCYFLQQDGLSGGATGATGLTADQFKKQNSFTKWDFGSTDTTGIWKINTTLNRPVLTSNHEDDGSEDHPYEIFTATQLETFRDIVNGTNGQRQNKFAHAKLMNNIDLSSVCSKAKGNWTPIGNIIDEEAPDSFGYTGTFDGAGHTISGLYINDSTANDQGLFGFVGSEGTVQNLSVSGSVKGGSYVGGVVG